MSRSASDVLLTAAYWLAPVALGVAGLVFYQLQNAGVLSGGRIAAAKVVWLGLPILFWYILPALIVVDRRTAPGIRRAYGLFLINMLIRGIAELWLMYESKSWDYRYGIGHDLFSMLLLVWLGQRQRDTGALDRLLSRNLFVCAGMFAIEMGFVWYMMFRVGTAGGAQVFFVPPDPEHASILLATWVANILFLIYYVAFGARWQAPSEKG